MSCKCFDQKPQCRPTDDFIVRLEASKCHCTSRFTVQERKCKFAILSRDISVIDKYKIDGHFDTDATHDKCDYLFRHHPANPEKNTCLFVELKGIDIEHAVKQIGDTIDRQPCPPQGYIRAFCFSPAPLPRYFERASLNFQMRSSTKVRRAGLNVVSSRIP